MSGLNLFSQLHDATLHRIEFNWLEARVRIELTAMLAGGNEPGRFTVVATGATRLEAPRELSWGASASVNELRCTAVPGGAIRLEIEMQSGDTLRVDAQDVTTERGPSERAAR